MKELVCCIVCKREISKKGIFTHYDRVHLLSQKYSSGNNGKYAEISVKKLGTKKILQEEYYRNPTMCSECNTSIEFDLRQNKFCNSQCSATFNNRKRTIDGWRMSDAARIKISEKLTGKRYKTIKTARCLWCGGTFEIGSAKKFCSGSCRSQAQKRRRESRPSLINYRADYAFRFSVKDYPNEFELSLITEHGWYKAKNNGDNLYGVSRDHMISVRYGFDNNISAEHLTHPANCRLLRQSENSSKGVKNHISYEELLERIRLWDLKYS